jgi:murein DD-endopeptidase MepM/ murein hydrolase activator NlpD
MPAMPSMSSIRGVSVRRIVAGLGHERTVAIAVAGIVLGASFLSVAPGRPSGSTGGPSGDGPEARLAVGGSVENDTSVGNVEADYVGDEPASAAYVEPAPNVNALSRLEGVDVADPEAQAAISAQAAQKTAVEGPFLDDGTLLKPVAVDTSVADGSSLMRTYKVKAGDTLAGIADRFDVTTMTVWWANKPNLKSKDALVRGQELLIPPTSGLVVTVKATDTLKTLARRYEVAEAEIVATNELEDPNLVVGQVLMLPGAKGAPIKEPKPPKAPTKSSGGGGSSSGGGGGGGTTKPPKTYNGGNFAWPTSSRHISQYYHYGHYGLDIDGSTGDPIYAAAGGTVTYAGWKNNGGGYQVWIAHGSGLYTTYNHMSSVSVGRGQHVSRGQRIGRMGATGFATGSHLHFEVWKGSIWSGGARVNPLAYL